MPPEVREWLVCPPGETRGVEWPSWCVGRACRWIGSGREALPVGRESLACPPRVPGGVCEALPASQEAIPVGWEALPDGWNPSRWVVRSSQWIESGEEALPVGLEWSRGPPV